MKYGNCIFWGFLQKLRYGGSIEVRETPNYWVIPSVYWSKDGQTWWKYVDVHRVNTPNFWQKLFPIHTFLFRGVVVDATNSRHRSRLLWKSSAEEL